MQNFPSLFDMTDPGNSAPLPIYIVNEQVQALNVSITKEWQNAVTPDLRNHLVRKFLQTISAPLNWITPRDTLIADSIELAKQFEVILYEMANSTYEYYNLVAKEIYSIQQKFDAKRQQRHDQHMALNQGAATSATAMALDQLEQIINQRWSQYKTDPDASNSNVNTVGQPNHDLARYVS